MTSPSSLNGHRYSNCTKACFFWALTSILTASSANAAPPPLPRCYELANPAPGTRCYEETDVGVRVKPDGGKKSFKNIFQATQPEYVLLDVIIDKVKTNGNFRKPTKNMLSRDGQSAIVGTVTERLRKIRQVRGELEAKAATLTGPSLSEARGKLDALWREEKTYESVTQEITAAGQDSGKYEVVGWAEPHKCGALNLDTCGSWSLAKVYIIKRYVGSDTEAYARAANALNGASTTIQRLSASSQVSSRRQYLTQSPWNTDMTIDPVPGYGNIWGVKLGAREGAWCRASFNRSLTSYSLSVSVDSSGNPPVAFSVADGNSEFVEFVNSLDRERMYSVRALNTGSVQRPVAIRCRVFREAY